jgi:hypothetical protein
VQLASSKSPVLAFLAIEATINLSLTHFELRAGVWPGITADPDALSSLTRLSKAKS